jgi:hypothetical protein
MEPVPDWDNEASALRARLAILAKGRTRSEIARSTGTSITNVSRYLAGTRMPTEFSVAVIKGLGVNPAWWLAGEGTPFVADINAGTEALAGNLLELVEAINAVSKMKLGTLAGKRHLRVLRELNDALGAHERLRNKLNQHSRGIFEQILNDLNKSLEAYNVQQAQGLLQAAQQVARLCDDAGLHQKLLYMQSMYYAFLQQLDESLACQRRLMVMLLAGDGTFTEDACRNAVNLVLTLMTQSRLKEALRFCEATLKLITPGTPRWSALALLMFLQGRLQAELGDLLPGLAIMTRERALGGGLTEPNMRIWLTQHLLRAAMLRPVDAFGYGDDTPVKGLVIMDHACWLEQAEFLQRAVDYANRPEFNRMGELTRPEHLGPYLLRALVRKDRKAAAEYEAAHRRCTEDHKHYPQVFLAQLHRLAGDAAAARKAFAAAEKQFSSLPAEQHVGVLTRATHHRNALWLAESGRGMNAQAAAAREFFTKHMAAGFACFKDVAASHAK